MLRFLALFCLTAAVFAQTPASAPSWTNNPQIEERVRALLGQMTLEEKIGQLVQYSGGEATGPNANRGNYADLAAKGGIGSLFNLTGAADTNRMQHIAVERSRLHVPLLFGLDVIHGYRTVYPVPLGLSATWDTQLVEDVSRLAAREASAEGVRWTFSPMVDIARDARWGRIVEGAGEDPYLGSAIAAAYIRGYQGKSLSDPQSIAACTKHFVGYGAAEAGRDYNTTEIPDRLLRQVYLPPFKATADAGVATMMSAFNDINEVPATANPFTLSQVLRREWQFRGFVVSDWTAVQELVPHGIANTEEVAGRKAFSAGVDMDMESNIYAKYMLGLVRRGEISESQISDSVARILRVKFALGLFDHPYTDEKPTPPPSQQDLALVRRAAEESFVLLKNDGALPLAASAKRVALIGPLADDAAQMIGSWGGKGEPKDVVTLRQALAQRLQSTGGTLNYAKGTEILTDSDAGFQEALTAAQNSDVVIAALGENAGEMTGEAGSRTRLDIPGNQQVLLQRLVATGKPVILVLFSGRPLVLNWESQHANAILEAWFPGVQAGPALVRTLFGEVSPSGKLTTSFPRAVGQEPLYYNALNTGRPATGVDLTHPPSGGEEKYHSRYIDEQNSALFPFGFGLSYSRFTYSAPTISTNTISAKALNAGSATLRVSATVTNAGQRNADEIAQLYIRESGTSVSRPVRELKGFRRLALQPGGSQRIDFTLSGNELRFWNIDMQNIVEPAQLNIWVGGDSTSGTPVTVTITP
jgi:beta-glucosidase